VQGRIEITPRLSFTATSRMLVAALLQYNSTSASFDTNVRFRWEFKPGSDLFIVFSDGRHTDAPTSLQNRTFAVKIARLLRF
jgi:hypothetical protein